MPADAAGAVRQRHRAIGTVFLEQMRGKRTHPFAEAPVRLLQGDHVGADLAQHFDYPLGIAPPICPDGFAHIVTGDADHAGS